MFIAQLKCHLKWRWKVGVKNNTKLSFPENLFRECWRRFKNWRSHMAEFSDFPALGMLVKSEFVVRGLQSQTIFSGIYSITACFEPLVSVLFQVSLQENHISLTSPWRRFHSKNAKVNFLWARQRQFLLRIAKMIFSQKRKDKRNILQRTDRSADSRKQEIVWHFIWAKIVDSTWGTKYQKRRNCNFMKILFFLSFLLSHISTL